MRQQVPTLLEEAPISEASRHWEGQVVDGEFLLREYLGGSDRSAVFLTEHRDADSQKAAIKLVPEIAEGAELQLSQWQSAAGLSHPHLLRIYRTGRCRVGSANLLYVVMEYAEENLAQILPQRALAPDEACDMLKPVLDALAYLHEKSFLHGHIKPSNIMACADQLKLATDGLRPMGHSIDPLPGSAGAYDPPGHEGSPAADVWSLGMSIVEVLTQRLPMWERVNNTDPVVPATLPPPFLDIARGCLRRDPLMRWKVADIASRLDPSPVHLQRQREPVRPSASPKGRYLAVAGAIALLLVVIAAWPRSHTSPPQATEISPAAPETSSAPVQPKPGQDVQRQAFQAQPAHPQSAPRHVAQAPVVPAAKSPVPGATESVKAQQPVAAAKPSISAPVAAPVVEAKRETRAGAAQVAVVHQVLPDVPQKARGTIRGKVRVSVKVTVDPAGSVSSAILDDSGPSRYFASLALRAAEQWKFTATQGASSEWILRFVFSADDTQAFPTRKAR